MAGYLDRLLAPYQSAIAGTPTTEASMSEDPLYKLLFPQPGSSPTGGGMGSTPADLLALARKLTKKGFSVSELEGFHGQGPITSGHVENSLHYSGDAADINYYGGGRWDNEQQALDWLYGWLNKRYDPQELLWQVPDHYDHLHIGGI